MKNYSDNYFGSLRHGSFRLYIRWTLQNRLFENFKVWTNGLLQTWYKGIEIYKIRGSSIIGTTSDKEYYDGDTWPYFM